MMKKVNIAAAVVAIGGFTAPAALAQQMTLSLGSPSLLGHVSITEPVTVSCSGFDPSLVVFAEAVSINVQQASGREIARGEGGGFPPVFPCDGSQNTLPVVIAADPSGPPFHGGAAVFTASGSVSAGTPCGPGCFFGPFETASASAGPTSLKLH